MLGRGFIYNDNKIWYPKEVWIYNPINQISYNAVKTMKSENGQKGV